MHPQPSPKIGSSNRILTTSENAISENTKSRVGWVKEWHKAMPLLRERRQLEAALGGPRNSLGEDLGGRSCTIVAT